MKRIVATLFTLLAVSFAVSARADIIDDAKAGQELLFERRYDDAIALFERIELEYPGSPTGAFGLLTAWQLRMFENYDFRFKDEYEQAERKFERLSSKELSGNPSSWDMFVSGAGFGMRGFFYAREGRWFRALGSAVRAVQVLKRLRFEDKDFVDAYLGIGMYNYWRSALTKGLHFLPFFGDHRQEGIEQVELVIKDGNFAKQLAQSNMAFIYAKEKEYDKAFQILNDFIKKYPNNIILRQLRGDIYIDTKKYDKAVEEYEHVLKMDPAMTKCLYRLGRIYFKSGKLDLAKDYFERYLATNPEKNWAASTKQQLAMLAIATANSGAK